RSRYWVSTYFVWPALPAGFGSVIGTSKVRSVIPPCFQSAKLNLTLAWSAALAGTWIGPKNERQPSSGTANGILSLTGFSLGSGFANSTSAKGLSLLASLGGTT